MGSDSDGSHIVQVMQPYNVLNRGVLQGMMIISSGVEGFV